MFEKTQAPQLAPQELLRNSCGHLTMLLRNFLIKKCKKIHLWNIQLSHRCEKNQSVAAVMQPGFI